MKASQTIHVRRRRGIQYAAKAKVAAALLAASATWAQVTPQNVPPPTRGKLLSSAQVQRDAKQWTQALALYRQGQTLYPQDKAFVFGEIYALADSGQSPLAVTQAQKLLELTPDDPDALLVMSYASLRKQGEFGALEYADRALQAAPDKRYVVTNYVDALERTRQGGRALEIAQQHTDWFEPTRYRQLQSSAMAENVRQALLPTRSEAERFILADKALARYEALFTEWKAAGDVSKGFIDNARIDRISALYARQRMGEATAEYETLLNEQVTVPDYALANIADAYLAIRRPEQARDIYQQLIDHGYMKGDEQELQRVDSGLINSYSDQGATATSQMLAAPLPELHKPWNYAAGDPVRRANDAYLESRQTAAMMNLYADDTEQSQQELESLLNAAPGNHGIRLDLSTLYRIRGWPRAAETELKLVEAMDPRSITLENAQAQTALQLREWRQARDLVEDISARAPDDPSIQRIKRQWYVHNLYELQIGGYKGLSNGSPVAGNQDFGLESTLYSPPINESWRLFAGGGHRTSRFSEGNAQLNFARMGVEWRSRDWTAQAEANDSHYRAGSRSGAAFSANYFINDKWQINTGLQWRSTDTSLRALLSGVTSNRFNLGVSWRDSERRSASLNLAPSRFSDGNRRTDILFMGQQRLLTQPRWSIDLGLEAYSSKNSRNDVSYYSPSKEYGITPTLTWNHIIYRRYQTAWTQQASVGLGSVYQQGFSSGSTGVISYGQRYKSNDVFEAGATLSAVSRPYDGVREREWRLIFDLTFRF